MMRQEAPVTLESLAFNWGDAYLFSYARDRWVALRRDHLRFLTAGTLAGLEHAIEADHRDHPVPRHFDPPGAADYLDLPGGGMAGEETPFMLAALRHAFPSWTITYAEQMRAWIARTGGRTICVNSAVMLCAALMLIEGKEHQARHGPRWDRPPRPGIFPS
jgi:hypothetical protein